MVYLKFLAVLFANIFLLIAVALSLPSVNNFVIPYIVLQTISLIFNLFIGVGFWAEPPNKEVEDLCPHEWHIGRIDNRWKTCKLCRKQLFNGQDLT